MSGAAAELARRRKARRVGEEEDGDHGGGAGSRGVESARVGALSPLFSFKLVKSQMGCLIITLRYRAVPSFQLNLESFPVLRISRLAFLF